MLPLVVPHPGTGFFGSLNVYLPTRLPSPVKPLLIAASLLLNVVLALMVAARSPSSPPALRDFFSRPGSPADSNGAATKISATPSPTFSKNRPLWSTLVSDDPATLVARLRAAGFPASIIRALVSSQINARYNTRLRPFTEPDGNTFWKNTNVLNAERMAEYIRIEQERSRIFRELFKDEFFANADVSPAQRRFFGNLPAGKIGQLERIEADYEELGEILSSSRRGITLPNDLEKMALLDREKKADLAVVLSPEEFADYQMRSSMITRLLAGPLSGFDPSESEFRAIFQMQQTLNEKFPYNTGAGLSYLENDPERLALHAQLDEQLKTTLGAMRYAEYVRETNGEFRQLKQLVQRDKLPASAAIQAFNIRELVSQESNQIFDDPSLTGTQKRSALQLLAQNARSQFLAILGPTSGPAYVKLAESGWLKTVEVEGAAVSFNQLNGRMTSATNNSTGSSSAIYLSNGSTTYRRLPNPTSPQPNP
jgi:hypothetical protein